MNVSFGNVCPDSHAAAIIPWDSGEKIPGDLTFHFINMVIVVIDCTNILWRFFMVEERL